MYRLLILGYLSVSVLVASSAANAACVDPNTCFGTQALDSNSSGTRNSAFGYQALFSNIYGWDNTAVGFQAMFSNVGPQPPSSDTGTFNTAIGTQALYANGFGAENTATGAYALRDNRTGRENTANGSRSLLRNEGGENNAAVGFQALMENVTGYYNTAVGSDALSGNVGSYYNTATGYYALNRTTNGGNTATGALALTFNTTGGNNTASGFQALQGDAAGITGGNNTATGANSLFSVSSGNGNSATGFDSLRSNTSGNRNTANGINSLSSVTSGFRNVALGAGAGRNIVTGSDNIVIGAEIPGRAAENGVIRIGRSTFQKKTYIAGIRGVTTGLSAASPVYIDANGQLGTIQSSAALKEDIRPIGSVSERLFALRPVTFRYKAADDDSSKPLQFGLIAEEVAEAFPELAIFGPDGKPETVRYELLASLMLNELQRQRAISEAQASRIAELESEKARMSVLAVELAAVARRVTRLERPSVAEVAP